MNKRELEPTIETAPMTALEPEKPVVNHGALLTLCDSRQSQLAEVKDLLGLKYLHDIEKKLERECQVVDAILSVKKNREERLALYSHILDTHYFEQQLLL